MGIDLLDIVFRLEKTFSITIDRGDLVPAGIIDDTQGKYAVNGKLTAQGLEMLKERIPSADLSSFVKDPMIVNLPTILTVKSLCDLVEQKIRVKNEGIDEFPNVLRQINHSVPVTLSEYFNVTDSSIVERTLRLEQLAEFSDPPLPAGFWKKFYKVRRDDPDELKAIKAYIRSREFVSVWNTFGLSFGITFILCLWLWIFGIIGKDVLSFLVILFVPSIMLFSLRFIVNWGRRRKASRVAVGEIIDYLIDQRPNRSVRADGLPYSRAEIEQGVADALCESLAVKPEEIKPEAQIFRDLGAA